MAICKTVDLDLRASEIFKGKGDGMKPLQLTGDSSDGPSLPVAQIATDNRTVIMAAHENGLTSETIAKRIGGMTAADVDLVIAAQETAVN